MGAPSRVTKHPRSTRVKGLRQAKRGHAVPNVSPLRENDAKTRAYFLKPARRRVKKLSRRAFDGAPLR